MKSMPNNHIKQGALRARAGRRKTRGAPYVNCYRSIWRRTDSVVTSVIRTALPSLASTLRYKTMRVAIFSVLLLALPDAYAGTRCEISGDARLWAYDACLWRYETDDTLHPVVISCADKNQALIAKAGSCQAKRIFKGRIRGGPR